MPERHGAAKDQDGKLVQEAVEEMEKRTEVLLVGFAAKADEKSKGGSLQPACFANAKMLRDHDHMLTLSTNCRGLVTFQPKIPVGPLGPNESRFKTLPEHLPQELKRTLAGRKFRSSIMDSVTDSTRMECGWNVYRQALWSVADQGSTGWPAKLVKYYHWELRGSETPDPIHRRIQIWMNSATEAGLHFVMAEYELFFSFFHAPFGSNENYNQVVKAFIHMHKAFDHKFFLFQALYAWIVFADCNGIMPPGFGSDEHQVEVWQRLPLATFLENIGTMCSRNRWLE